MEPVLYMAPIRGVTDRIFRNVFSEFFKGIDIAVTPFVDNFRKGKQEKSLLNAFAHENNDVIKIIPQILSNDPSEFIFMANFLFEHGFDTVNWNLGCPYPMVMNRGKGAAMLRYPDKIDSFLEKTVPALKGSLSVKLRLGMDLPDEILALAPVFERHKIEELIIHARTARQMYDGPVDLDSFRLFTQSTAHRIVYNGDIESLRTYNEMQEKFPHISRWMIGRGILTNPFLAEEIKTGAERSEEEMILQIHSFHDELLGRYSEMLYGPAHITDKMKGIWFYMSEFFEDSRKIYKRIKKTYNERHYIDVVESLFRNDLRIKQRIL